jgi:hypothetical protein
MREKSVTEPSNKQVIHENIWNKKLVQIMTNKLQEKLNLCKCTNLKISNINICMDTRLCIYEHFDLIFNSKYKCET